MCLLPSNHFPCEIYSIPSTASVHIYWLAKATLFHQKLGSDIFRQIQAAHNEKQFKLNTKLTKITSIFYIKAHHKDIINGRNKTMKEGFLGLKFLAAWIALLLSWDAFESPLIQFPYVLHIWKSSQNIYQDLGLM